MSTSTAKVIFHPSDDPAPECRDQHARNQDRRQEHGDGDDSGRRQVGHDRHDSTPPNALGRDIGRADQAADRPHQTEAESLTRGQRKALSRALVADLSLRLTVAAVAAGFHLRHLSMSRNRDSAYLLLIDAGGLFEIRISNHQCDREPNPHMVLDWRITGDTEADLAWLTAWLANRQRGARP